MSRRFLEAAAFAPERDAPYYLLPFRFQSIGADREVLVNEVGDHLLCPRGTAHRVANREVTTGDPIYPDLVANFFISETPVPDLIDVFATRYRTKKSFLDTFTSLHIIVVTLRCDHTCSYCQVSRQTQASAGFDISLKDLERSIELAFRSPAPDITIEFQGGEPLLAFDRVSYAVERAHEMNCEFDKDLQFVLCTNLTLVTHEILDFCKNHDILISTSLDGPAFVHNRNRRNQRSSSYDLFLRGLQLTRDVLGQDRVSALMTTSTFSLDHPGAIVDAYRDNGFDHVFFRAINPYGFALRGGDRNGYSTDRFTEFFKRGLRYILDINKSGERFVEDYSAIILKKILTPFPVGFVDLQSPSGIVNSVVVYNYDGGVYVSDEGRMLAETGDNTFQLGNVSDSYESLFYGRKARTLANHWSNEALAGCSECGFQTFCGADPVRHYATQGHFEGFRPESDYCQKNMEIIRFLFELLDTDPEAERIFRSWARS